jgi:hypothetical protein
VSGELDHARELLARVPSLEHPSDLDLFVFFAKHPRTLITSEQLARMLGYPLNQIAQSLDVLLAAGWLTRAQNRSRLARMYVFAPDNDAAGWLPALVELASSRQGRLALRRALSRRAADYAFDGRPQAGATSPTSSGVRPFRARPKLETVRRSRSDEQRRGNRDG